MSKVNSKIILKNGNKVFSVGELKVDFKSDEFNERINTVDFDFIDGEEKEIILDGVKIYFGNLNIDGKVVLDIAYEIPFLMINFELEGDSVFTPKKISKQTIPFNIKTGEYNFFYNPKMEGTLSYNCKKRSYFSLFFSEEYVKNLFKNNFHLISGDFGKALKNKQAFLMFNKSKPIPYKILEIISEIKKCCYEKELKEIYIQSKIMEIFAYLFVELNKKKSEKSVLKVRDIELVRKAEKLISENIAITLTLDELSQQIGSNKFKLKRDFKLVFDESVFAYQKRLRMKKAKELLVSSDSTISEVSYAVGYKNPQHFTTAFKKQFDCLPSIFRESKVV